MKTTLQKKMSVLVMWCVFFSLVSNDVYAGEETVVSFGSVAWITNSENSLTINKMSLQQQEEWTDKIKKRVALLICSIYSSQMFDNYIVDYELPLDDKDTYYLIATPKISAPEDLPILLIGLQINNEGELHITTEKSLPIQMTHEWIRERLTQLQTSTKIRLDFSKRDTGTQPEYLLYLQEKLIELKSTTINRLMLVYNPTNGLIDCYRPID